MPLMMALWKRVWLTFNVFKRELLNKKYFSGSENHVTNWICVLFRVVYNYEGVLYATFHVVTPLKAWCTDGR